MVRNAEDICGTIVSHMMEELDYVIVADNLSTDGTRDILNQLSKNSNLMVVDDNDPAHRQSEKTTALAQLAKRLGATWVVPFDSDEWWYSLNGNRLADVIRQNDSVVYPAAIYDHVPTSTDSENLCPVRRMVWRKAAPSPLHKVACKIMPDLVIAEGNHNAFYQSMPAPPVSWNKIAIRHFPYRTEDQFVEKAVLGALALELTDLPYEIGTHWRDYYKIYQEEGVEALKGVFRKWFYSINPEDEDLVRDPVIP